MTNEDTSQLAEKEEDFDYNRDVKQPYEEQKKKIKSEPIKPMTQEESDTYEKQKQEFKEKWRKDHEVSDMEREAILNNMGAHVECQMSRGPPIRGILKGFDPKYAKLAIEEDGAGGVTFLRMGYISALRIDARKG